MINVIINLIFDICLYYMSIKNSNELILPAGNFSLMK